MAPTRFSTLYAGTAGNERLDMKLHELTKDRSYLKVPLDQKNVDPHQNKMSIQAVMGAIGDHLEEQDLPYEYRATWRALWNSLFVIGTTVHVGGKTFQWEKGLPRQKACGNPALGLGGWTNATELVVMLKMVIYTTTCTHDISMTSARIGSSDTDRLLRTLYLRRATEEWKNQGGNPDDLVVSPLPITNQSGRWQAYVRGTPQVIGMTGLASVALASRRTRWSWDGNLTRQTAIKKDWDTNNPDDVGQRVQRKAQPSTNASSEEEHRAWPLV